MSPFYSNPIYYLFFSIAMCLIRGKRKFVVLFVGIALGVCIGTNVPKKLSKKIQKATTYVYETVKDKAEKVVNKL